MGSRGRIESVLSIVVAAAAILVAAAVVRREFFSSQRASTRSGNQPPTYEAAWTDVLPHAIETGPPRAPVRIVEFFDLECPACRHFHRGTLRQAKDRFGDSLAVSLVHFPLPNHRFARPAAIASECAASQGRFAEFVDVVYERQDSLGLKSWGSYAQSAGVPDTIAFLRCVNQGHRLERVDSGMAIGERLAIGGTPTILVNGWRYSSPPSSAELTRVVAAFLSGQQPFAEK